MTHLDSQKNNPKYISVLKGLLDPSEKKDTSTQTKKPSRKDPTHSQTKKSDQTHSKVLDLTRNQ